VSDDLAPVMPDMDLGANAFGRATGLRLTSASGQRVTGVVEVGPEQHTPWGVVHGGVYATAIESACSVGASVAVADEGMFAVGLSNQTDFLRPHREGELHVTATPVHRGRTQQLWQCDIARADGKLVARGQVRLQNVPFDEPGG
jgi:1,4-dihydroxy-2-naphthoyl-CoA hydrolase